MLSIIKRKKKLIILILLMILVIFIAHTVWGGDYDSLYNNLYNDSKSYKNQNKVNDMKDIAPQYDKNKANYQDAKNQDSADRFMDYGTKLTSSCSVNTVEQTKEISCKDRVEHTYEDISVTQSKVLDNINYQKTTVTDYVTKYYCDITDHTYDTQNQCESDCEDETQADITYTCDEGAYSSATNKCEQPVDTTTTYQGCSAISYWDTPSNANTFDFFKDASFRLGENSLSLFLKSGETYSTTSQYGTISYTNKSNTTNYIYERQYDSSYDGSTTITTYTFNRNTCELNFVHDPPPDAIIARYHNLTLQPGESKTYGDILPVTLKNTSTLRTTYTCPSGTTKSGDKCISNPNINYECPVGYTLINGNTCLKTESCSDMPTTEKTTIYNAKFAYYLDPPSFDPLVNCSFGQFICVDNRNKCVTKNASFNCIKYDNVCFEYKHSGICQREIEHIYKDCDYNISSESIN